MTQEETTIAKKTTSNQGKSQRENEEKRANAQENGAQQAGSAQQNQDGGQVEITMNAPPGQQNQQPQQRGPQSREPVKVRVSGTERLAFTGRVGSYQGLRRVEGSLPAKYEISFAGAAVTAAIRKREPGAGTIKVEVVRKGRAIASQKSSSTTGVVNLVWTPQ